MKLQQTNLSQFKNSKSMPSARGHIIGKIESTTSFKINSVFLRNKNFVPKINWQTELLKLNDAP